MKRHFVTFYSPGTFVAEQDTRAIDSWDIEAAQKMAKSTSARYNAKPFGFRFSTRERGPKDLDSKVSKRSPMYFINCKVETLKEIVARNKPDEKTLRSNMEVNGFDRVVVTIKGWKWTQPLGPDDVVL